MKAMLRTGLAAGVALAAALSAPLEARGAEDASSYARMKSEVTGRFVYARMMKTMRDARSLSWASDYVWRTDSTEVAHAAYRIWMKKPNFARIEAQSADGTHRGTIVLDGRELWTYWPTGRPPIPGADTLGLGGKSGESYLRKKAPRGAHSLAHETWLLGTGMTMTILEPSVFHGASDPMSEHYDGARIVGSAMEGGEDCDILEARFMKGQRTRVFWVSKRDHLPRRIEETVRLKRSIITRERWSDVVINADITRDLFAWRPPDGWVEIKLPALEDGLLPPGSDAPDFEGPLAGGGRFRLSENRGKIVWLCFWRIACPPCREELPHLGALSEKNAGDDLVIVGFNFADEREAAEEYLRKRSPRLPSVLDSSPRGREIFTARYQTVEGKSAVPLNYIIDERGKVVEGWYGYRKGEERGMEIIRALRAAGAGASAAPRAPR